MCSEVTGFKGGKNYTWIDNFLSMLSEILSALILGLVGGIIPGPVLTATFTAILQSGFLKSFRIILWAMFVETVVAALSLGILSVMNLSVSVFQGLSFFGALILVWIAMSLWKIQKIDTGEKAYFSLGKIALMILANGMLWTYWITVCVPKAISLGEKVSFGSVLFLIFVEVGWLVSTALVAFVFS